MRRQERWASWDYVRGVAKGRPGWELQPSTPHGATHRERTSEQAKEGREAGRQEGRKEGRREGRNERTNERTNEVTHSYIVCINATYL